MKLLRDYHPSWGKFLTEEIKQELSCIESQIGDDICPDEEKVLRFLSNDLSKIKVVILGQDPYPEKGRATGRSFEVGDLKDWNDKFKQVSLKNIVRLIYKDYMLSDNESVYDVKFSQIQKEIKEGKFNISPPNKLFENWENQGVLLLNTYLTIKAGNPGSHRKSWDNFSKKLLEFISTNNKNITWFLWGSYAISMTPYIVYGKMFQSNHPMICSDKKPDDFLKFQGFKNTKQIINWIK